MTVTVNKVFVSSLKTISVVGGDVMHGLKEIDDGYIKFGEAYFSYIKKNKVKAWKKHKLMQLNLIVPKGDVLFVFKDALDNFREEKIGESNQMRLTVPPSLWFGFKGINSKESVILNISNMMHDDREVEKKEINEINYDWKTL